MDLQELRKWAAEMERSAIAAKAKSFEQFIDAATTHMVVDPAWSGHEHEWMGPNSPDSPVTPWEWWRKNVAQQPQDGAP